MRMKNLTGLKFGYWTVTGNFKREGVGKSTAIYWFCQCVCGNSSFVRANGLTRGVSKSCGCVHEKSRGKRPANYRHGMTHTRTWLSWKSMKQRCLNPKATASDRYLGRGIDVCKKWLSFDEFLKDMGERPIGKTLDRIKNEKGYSPSNCRWATPKEQAQNRRNRTSPKVGE